MIQKMLMLLLPWLVFGLLFAWEAMSETDAVNHTD